MHLFDDLVHFCRSLCATIPIRVEESVCLPPAVWAPICPGGKNSLIERQFALGDVELPVKHEVPKGEADLPSDYLASRLVQLGRVCPRFAFFELSKKTTLEV